MYFFLALSKENHQLSVAPRSFHNYQTKPIKNTDIATIDLNLTEQGFSHVLTIFLRLFRGGFT